MTITRLTDEQAIAEKKKLAAAVRDILASTPDALVPDVHAALAATGYTNPWGLLPQPFQIHDAIQQTRPIETITSAAEAASLMAKLANRFDDVGVFHDRGWGSAPLEISIIVDGSGHTPIALLTEDVYGELFDQNMIGPNILHTAKVRRFHAYTGKAATR